MLLAACASATLATRPRSKCHKEKQADKAELHEWENEGGNLAPYRKASDALVTTGSA
jgi:hypothetical protein